MAPIIVFLLRLIVPLGIFKKPLLFGVIALLLDGADVILIDGLRALGVDGFPQVYSFFDWHYHFFDKYFDTYYLLIECIVSLRWKEKFARNTSIVLFLWRLAGFILFEITHIRLILFFAPNLFENFFLFYLIARKVSPGWEVRNGRRLAIALFLLYIPKFGQEYLLHLKQAQPWEWFKATFL